MSNADGSRVVTVFGSSHPEPGDAAYEQAHAAGHALARAGFTLANGGYGGAMRASAQGAQEGGGRVIGVTCAALGRPGPNVFVTEERQTATLDERLNALIAAGDAYVALPGGTGTLLEVAKVWELAHKGLGGRAKPIVLVGGFWQALVAMMQTQDPQSLSWIQRADSIDAMMACLGTLS